MTKSEKDLAEFIIENINKTKDMSIIDLSDFSNTSTSTISRFSKKLGYKNFQDMRTSLFLYFNKSSEDSFFKVIDSSSDINEIANYIFDTSSKSLSETKKNLDMNMLEKVVSLLGKSKRCGVFGIGGSSIVALNFYHRFLRSSLEIVYSPDFHLQLMNAGKLNNEDAAFIISHSGVNNDIMRIIDILKEKNCKIIIVTGNPKSPIALRADLVLYSISEEVKYRPEAFSSIDAQICIVDAIFTGYALKIDKNPEIFMDARKIINDTRIKDV